MIKNGGYTMLDLAVATYKDAAQAFNVNKPIMVYDNSQVYYADTCVYDTDNDAYVLTKGGKTITIDSSNNVVSSGDIQNHLYLLIGDSTDLSFDDPDYSAGHSNYYKIISSKEYKKLSDLPNGEYQIVVGSVFEESTSINYQIQSLKKNSDGYYLYLSNDAYVKFTIANDNNFNRIQLF